MGFPSRTWPGLLDDLNRLAFPYRWCVRAVAMDKTDATKVLTRIRRQWFAKRKSIAAIVKEVMTNESSVLMDSDAANKAVDADMALQELGSDLIGAGLCHRDRDGLGRGRPRRRRASEARRENHPGPRLHLHPRGRERGRGLARDRLPGQLYANVRQPPISTLNLAHMMPFSAVWAGTGARRALRRAAAVRGQDRGLDPVPLFAPRRRRRPHVGGRPDRRRQKSVLLAVMAMQFRRYDRSQVFAFDFGGSHQSREHWPWAVTGTTSAARLSDDAAEPVALQPLARIDLPEERGWAAEWVAAILSREKVLGHPGGEGTPVVVAGLAGLGARERAHADRLFGPPTEPGAEARAPALLPERAVGPAARRRCRAARRSPTCRRSRPRG